jgi:hypothetical protein
LIFDDGWVWHPISIPRIWSVTNWLASNPWESEDGVSITDLGMRDDWTQSTCWVDEQHIAMWGAVAWDEEAGGEVKRGPGVWIFDVTGPKPSMREWWPMPGVQKVSDLFSDGECLYIAGNAGTTVWDIDFRAQIAEFPEFIARLLDRSRDALLSFEADAIREISLAR